jgi:predicted nucleic acid-binding protein
MSAPPIRYWDAATFLAWLKPEPARKPACEGWLDLARQGKLLIVTSTVTLAEVVKFDKSDILNLPPETAATIEGFFRNSWISLRNVDPDIGERARGLMWDHALRVRDAIHLATALRYRAPFLDTYDDQLVALNDRFPEITIGYPPQVPVQLSAEALMATPGAEGAESVAAAAEAEFATIGLDDQPADA